MSSFRFYLHGCLSARHSGIVARRQHPERRHRYVALQAITKKYNMSAEDLAAIKQWKHS